ncbi:MAG: glycosyltransferase [Deltaproteobacteria bacterium]|nr:glycosyltransferase [Deltaproteobacteria bacterium]
MNAKVTVVLPIYNGQRFLDQCLPPLFEMDYPNYDIIVVDDGSSDETVKHLKQCYPQVRIIQLQKRSGHSKACNTGILATDARYVYIIEHHTIVKKDTLSQLMKVMLSESETAICYSRQFNVYSENNIVVEGKRYAHYVVNQQCERIPLSELNIMEDEQPVDVSSSGTFSYLIDKEKFTALGYFDEDYFVHIADYELTLRAKAAGFKCYYVPKSISYHKSFAESAKSHNYRGGDEYPAFRTYVIVKNRWFTILSHYSLNTLLLIFPALILYELLLIGFVIRRNVFLSYVKAMGWLFSHPGILLKKRRHIQQIKKVKDSSLLVAGELNFVPGLAQSLFEQRIIRFLTIFLTGYWNLVKRFL